MENIQRNVLDFLGENINRIYTKEFLPSISSFKSSWPLVDFPDNSNFQRFELRADSSSSAYSGLYDV